MAQENVPLIMEAVGRCWMAVKQTGRRLLKEYDIDLTIEQVIVLKLLSKQDGMNLSEIAEHADRERTTITRMIDGLERRNLVVRIADKVDKRIKLVYMTRAGREKLTEVEVHIPRFQAQAFAGIEGEKLDETVQVLLRICDNLGFDK